jgi:hypothetical protein
LFYNGDPDFGTNGGNFLDCDNCRSASGVEVYDDFQISSGLWDVTGIFGNYETLVSSPLPTTAHWEIREGVSQGNGGTLLASGTANVNITANPVPAAGSTSDSYWNISAAIGSVILGPGTYWVTLAPNASSNETYLIGTDGANGVDSLIDGTSYVNGTYFTWQNVGNYEQPFTGSSAYDFSYGLTGTVPEPSSLLMLGAALAAIAGVVRKRQFRD